MKYKKSKFCVCRFYDDSIVLANIYSGHIVKFRQEYKDDVSRFINEEYSRCSTKLFNYLSENGFLVDSSLDEEEIESKTLEELKNNNGLLSLIIMPTDDCNFRCPYCYENHNKKVMTKDYLDRIALFVDRNIENYKGLHVEWFGGEPLLELESIYYLSEKFVSISKKRKKPYIANMTTNGYHLTVDVFLKLKKLHFLGYQITIDGLEKDHDKQRFLADGTGTWKVIINNLRAIKSTPCKGFTNITIRSNFTVDMLKDGKSFVDFLAKEFSDDRRFNFFIRTVADFGGDRIHDMMDKLILDKQIMIDLLSYASSKGLKMQVNKNFIRAGGIVCYANKRNFYILASDEKVRKSTCEYENTVNHLGRISASGQLEIDRKKEDYWVTGYSCNNKECKSRITCGGDGCPRNHLIHKNNSCVWNAGTIDEILNVLIRNDNATEIYSEE